MPHGAPPSRALSDPPFPDQETTAKTRICIANVIRDAARPLGSDEPPTPRGGGGGAQGGGTPRRCYHQAHVHWQRGSPAAAGLRVVEEVAVAGGLGFHPSRLHNLQLSHVNA
jgi:hypothetical protein